MDVSEIKNLPSEIISIAEELMKLAQAIMGQEIEEMPKVVVQAAFPPCINALYADAAQAHHLSHIGRFTLTSFMVNIGMTPEGLNEMFKTFSDYNERLTRYQIEHIAGERGQEQSTLVPNARFCKLIAYARTVMSYAAVSIIRFNITRESRKL